MATPVVQAPAVQSPNGVNGVALYQFANVGYASNQSWKSDVAELMSLLQSGAVQPNKLSIWTSQVPGSTAKSWIDQFQMQVQVGGKVETLTRYGRSPGQATLQTLNGDELQNVTSIEFWGIKNNNGHNVLGQLTFHFGAGLPSQTFGNCGTLPGNHYFGTLTPPAGTSLLGFSASTGADVDGLAPIFG
jgi:hypothetical protein